MSSLFPYMLATALLAVALVAFGSSLTMAQENSSLLIEWSVQGSTNLRIDFPVFLDPLALAFVASVALVSSAVFVFSSSYMASEKFFLRFHILVFSFVLCMVLLIVSPNLISLLFGWDGLGVTSFLLVIYFRSKKSNNAGMLTVLSNRIGDVAILLCIAYTSALGEWSLYLNSEHCSLLSSTSSVLGFLVLAGFTKSAQIPFSAWLPAAMAAPTPVSSLVHSSTLVTAGVYLLIRLTELLNSSDWSTLVLCTGTLTTLMAGVSALMEMDLKKMIALSTLSQLGMMMVSVGLGNWWPAFLHLLAHAYFKASLFMVAGNTIHLAHDYQDLRKASLGSSMKMTMSIAAVANFSLCGLPFTAGFFTKDNIIEGTHSLELSSGIWALLVLATSLTAAYSVRLVYLLSWSPLRLPSLNWAQDGDSGVGVACAMLMPLGLMAGSGLMDLCSHSISPMFLSLGLKNLTTSSILVGGLGGSWMAKNQPLNETGHSLNSWGQLWALPQVSWVLPSYFTLFTGNRARQLDQGWMANFTLAQFLGETHLCASDKFWSPFLSANALILSASLILILLVVY